MPETRSTLSELCVACGLCCDGSLFHFVSITAEESAALEGSAVTLLEANGRHSMKLNCTALDGKCCTMYRTRPSGCRGFVCEPGKRLESGAATFTESLELVDSAHARIAALAVTLGMTKGGVMAAARDGLSAQVPMWSDDVLAEARSTTSFMRSTFLGWS